MDPEKSLMEKTELEVKRLEEEDLRLSEEAKKFEEQREENLRLREEAKKFEEQREENLRIREEAKKLENLWKEAQAEYDRKFGDMNRTVELIENLKAEIISKIELQKQFDTVNHKLAQMMQKSTDDQWKMYDALSGRLAMAEEKIKEMDTKIRSSTADSIKSRLDSAQNKHIELQSKANEVMGVYATHLGVYALVFNLGIMLFQVHIPCKWAALIGFLLVVGFAVVLVIQVYLSICKIRNIGRAAKGLFRMLDFRMLDDLPVEAATSGSGSSTGTRSASPPNNSAPLLSTPGSDDRGLYIRRIVGLRKSLSKFASGFLLQMVTPATFIFIIFFGLMFSAYKNCDKASPAPPSSLLAR